MGEKKIDGVKERDKLQPRRDPYWHKLSKGCFVGFRKMTVASKGTWLARYRHEDTNKQSQRPLGDLSAFPPGEQFDLAKKAAEEWFKHLGRGGSTEATTIRLACQRYIQRLRDDGRESAADDAEARFERWVYSNESFAGSDLAKLRPNAVWDWRRDLKKTPVTVGKGDNATTRPRTDSALNRDMAALRAAFNLALEDGRVTSSFAWAKALKPIERADKRRTDKLNRDQRALLLRNASGELANFLKGLCLLPVRPGALAKLKVKNFDAREGTLTIGKDKAGGDRRIPLPPSTLAFFKAQAKGKLPEAALLANDTGGHWNKDQWKDPVKDAVKAAGLPATTTAYAVRHGVITDLVSDGLDPLTVAALAGTSVEMIERHYFHLSAERSRNALANLAL